MFTSLFSYVKAVVTLYNALSGGTLPADAEVEIISSEGVFSNELQNDVIFLVNGKMVVLVEHQSTINPNMALRLLLYIVHYYEHMPTIDDRFKRSRLYIPGPEFIVLYN